MSSSLTHFHSIQSFINTVSNPLEGNAHRLKRLWFIVPVIHHAPLDSQRRQDLGQLRVHIGLTCKVAEPVRQPLAIKRFNALTRRTLSIKVSDPKLCRRRLILTVSSTVAYLTQLGTRSFAQGFIDWVVDPAIF